MAKFQTKSGKGTPEIPTSALPDIIFILLFFFMAVTQIREVTLKIKNQIPKATELEKVKDRSLVKYIYIGKPAGLFEKIHGTEDKIQLNDRIVDDLKAEIGSFVKTERDNLPENKRRYMKISLKVDVDSKLGIVTDVKQELRKADALLLNLAANPRGEVY